MIPAESSRQPSTRKYIEMLGDNTNHRYIVVLCRFYPRLCMYRNQPIYAIRKSALPYDAAVFPEDERSQERASSRGTTAPSGSSAPSKYGRDRFSAAAGGRKALNSLDSRVRREHSASVGSQFEASLQKLEALLTYNTWIECNQLSIILFKFISRSAPTIVLARLICTLFNRIIDLENLSALINNYGSELKLEVFHRLGILNVWCPMMPDGNMEFDLAAWDHREACKLLIRLAVIEPGENWADECYSGSTIEPNVPGWELPTSWTEEDGEGKGPAEYGYVTLNYTSEASTGCSPVWPAREELTFARCLAGSRGSFIKGLKVRPKSRLSKTGDDMSRTAHAPFSRQPLYTEDEYFESESDIFALQANERMGKYFGPKAKFVKPPGKF